MEVQAEKVVCSPHSVFLRHDSDSASISSRKLKMLLIKSKFDEQPAASWIHRFRNFGEDVWRALESECDLSLDDVDRSIASIEIRGLKAKRIGRAKQTLRSLISSHGFDDDLLIEEFLRPTIEA